MLSQLIRAQHVQSTNQLHSRYSQLSPCTASTVNFYHTQQLTPGTALTDVLPIAQDTVNLPHAQNVQSINPLHSTYSQLTLCTAHSVNLPPAQHIHYTFRHNNRMQCILSFFL